MRPWLQVDRCLSHDGRQCAIPNFHHWRPDHITPSLFFPSPPKNAQVYGQASDIVLEVESTMKDNMRFLKELSDITGRTEAQIKDDFKCVCYWALLALRWDLLDT